MKMLNYGLREEAIDLILLLVLTNEMVPLIPPKSVQPYVLPCQTIVNWVEVGLPPVARVVRVRDPRKVMMMMMTGIRDGVTRRSVRNGSVTSLDGRLMIVGLVIVGLMIVGLMMAGRMIRKYYFPRTQEIIVCV